MPCSLLCYVTGILVGGNDIMLLHTYCRVGPTAGWALLQSRQWCPKISSFPCSFIPQKLNSKYKLL